MKRKWNENELRVISCGRERKEARNYEAIGLNGKIAIDIVCDLMKRAGDEEESQRRSRDVDCGAF